MPNPELPPASPALGAISDEISRLAKVVRRQTIAIWSLFALLVLMWAAPWILWFVQRNMITSADVTHAQPAATAGQPFDNNFSSRTPDEQIRRATVIFVTRRKPKTDATNSS